MPGGDGTGPRGMGPSIGRGLGFCGRAGVPGAAGGFRRPGLACRRGWGAGRGGYAAGAAPVGSVEYTAEDYAAWLTGLNTWLVKQPGAPQAAFTGEKPGRVITIRIMGALPAELVMDSDKHAALAAGLAKIAADEYLKRFETDLSVEITVEEQLSGGGMWMETFHDIVLRSEWEKQGGEG